VNIIVICDCDQLDLWQRIPLKRNKGGKLEMSYNQQPWHLTKNLSAMTLSITVWSAIMLLLSVRFHNSFIVYAECHYAECRNAVWRGTRIWPQNIMSPSFSILSFSLLPCVASWAHRQMVVTWWWVKTESIYIKLYLIRYIQGFAGSACKNTILSDSFSTMLCCCHACIPTHHWKLL